MTARENTIRPVEKMFQKDFRSAVRSFYRNKKHPIILTDIKTIIYDIFQQGNINTNTEVINKLAIYQSRYSAEHMKIFAKYIHDAIDSENIEYQHKLLTCFQKLEKYMQFFRYQKDNSATIVLLYTIFTLLDQYHKPIQNQIIGKKEEEKKKEKKTLISNNTFNIDKTKRKNPNKENKIHGEEMLVQWESLVPRRENHKNISLQRKVRALTLPTGIDYSLDTNRARITDENKRNILQNIFDEYDKIDRIILFSQQIITLYRTALSSENEIPPLPDIVEDVMEDVREYIAMRSSTPKDNLLITLQLSLRCLPKEIEKFKKKLHTGKSV